MHGLGIVSPVDHEGDPRLLDRAGDIGRLSVTYSVQPSSRQEFKAWAAWVMAIISAWAVGSRNCSR